MSRIFSTTLSQRFGHLVSGALISAGLLIGPIITGSLAAARAAPQLAAEFHTALAPYGRWHHHSRWGEVWIPGNRGAHWRPYTAGRWVYTEDWGWYWVEDDAEAPWGWVTYHYGRWIFDPDFGWEWVPGYEWGPAFVLWRSSDDYIGWAPLPPSELVVEYRDDAGLWCLTRLGEFARTSVMAAACASPQQAAVLLPRTVVANETVLLRDRQFAVNPGIAPAVVAAAIGRPLHAFDVRPRIIAGSARIPRAVTVGPSELRNHAFAQTSIRQTPNVIAPASGRAHAQPLGRGEHGRLGPNPPRAAVAAPAQLGGGHRLAEPQPRVQQPPSPPATQGRSTPQQPQQPPTPQKPSTRQEMGGRNPQRLEKESPAIEQRHAIEPRRQQIETERHRLNEPPQTEGRHAIAPSRQQLEPSRGRSTEQLRPPARPAPPRVTEGRGGGPVHVPQMHGPSAGAAPQVHAPAGPQMHAPGPTSGGGAMHGAPSPGGLVGGHHNP
jgi:hypothetical protein